MIDIQRYFVDADEGGAPVSALRFGAEAALNAARLVAAYRGRSLPVVFSRHSHLDMCVDGGMMALLWDYDIMEGTPESEIVPVVAPAGSEEVITKRRYSAFLGTELEGYLRRLGVEQVVVCGVMTNLCCETTARDAFMRDFAVFFAADATATKSEKMHLASLVNLAYGFATIVLAGEIVEAVSGG